MSIHLDADFAAHEFGEEGVALPFQGLNLEFIQDDSVVELLAL